MPITNKTDKSIGLMIRQVLLGCVILLAACGQVEIAPAAINPEDVCAFCKMAITEKQFAAQFINKDGEAFKFDDIGCMRDYLKAKADRNQIAAYFVADFESKKWLRAESVHFVRSARLATPMGGNIAAFETENKAADALAKYNGERASFADLIGK